jgi:hypothetical protein
MGQCLLAQVAGRSILTWRRVDMPGKAGYAALNFQTDLLGNLYQGMSRLSDWQRTGLIVSILAALISICAAIWTINIQKQSAAELARLKTVGGLDTKSVEFAMILLKKPSASVAERRWAVDVLSIAERVPMSGTRRQQIARSGRPLAEIGKFIPEAKELNDKLEAVPFWLDLAADVIDIIDVLPSVGDAASDALNGGLLDLQNLTAP